MKTIRWVVVCVCMSLWANAQQPGHYDLLAVNEEIKGERYVVNVVAWERQKLEITIDKPVGVPSEITLTSDDRLVLYSDQSHRADGTYRRWLNLSQLDSGRYWLLIRVGRDSIRRTISISSVSTESYRSLTMH